MKMIQEFKTFAMKGNVVDMAVGIIIGAAFGKIVSSLVNDVIMPPIGLLVGGIDFGNLSFTLKAATEAAPAVIIKYGVFINTIIDFVIVAWAIFMVIKGMNSLKKKQEEAPAAPPAPKEDIVLLTEIRNLLKK
ncbi:MAG: large-conductance mechanosensitive channel protein MscL [Ignavibacteria bacterium]|nr:large-conductance mechanosensitive channel protein MscL [Ignavibacteria bacterium]